MKIFKSKKELLEGEARMSEIGDRWASGQSSWSLSSRVNWSFAFLEIPRTKLMAGAECCWSKEDKRTTSITLEVKETSLIAHGPWGSKREGCHPIIRNEHTPFSLCTGIHLGKMCTWEGCGQARYAKGRDNWSEENKDQKKCPV